MQVQTIVITIIRSSMGGKAYIIIPVDYHV